MIQMERNYNKDGREDGNVRRVDNKRGACSGEKWTLMSLEQPYENCSWHVEPNRENGVFAATCCSHDTTFGSPWEWWSCLWFGTGGPLKTRWFLWLVFEPLTSASLSSRDSAIDVAINALLCALITFNPKHYITRIRRWIHIWTHLPWLPVHQQHAPHLLLFSDIFALETANHFPSQENLITMWNINRVAFTSSLEEKNEKKFWYPNCFHKTIKNQIINFRELMSYKQNLLLRNI